MHNNRIRTRYLMHTSHQLNRCAASVNTLVLYLSLISTTDRSLCPARPRHLAAAGVRYPARAPPRPTRLSGHLESPGPDSEFLILAPSGIHARAFQVLMLLGLARAVAPASDCTPVDRCTFSGSPPTVPGTSLQIVGTCFFIALPDVWRYK